MKNLKNIDNEQVLDKNLVIQEKYVIKDKIG